MRAAIFVLLVVAESLAALEIGKNYDFYQKNGQNLLGATVIAETPIEVTVKLSYLPKPIALKKANFEREPELSSRQADAQTSAFTQKLQKEFSINASLGASLFGFGQLGQLFNRGLNATLGGDWLLFKEPQWGMNALSLVTAYNYYPQSGRHVQMFSAYMGPKFIIAHFKSIDAALTLSPLFGASYADLKGYTFTAQYLSFSAVALVAFEKRFNTLVLAAQIFTNYLFDKSLNFYSTGINLAVHYPLGNARSY
ncbi:MAG: hypothetical protein JSR44_12930 [Spirochaetes bacterium]|nr:hypothetical protein [Spirochaetota bacterium]